MVWLEEFHQELEDQIPCQRHELHGARGVGARRAQDGGAEAAFGASSMPLPRLCWRQLHCRCRPYEGGANGGDAIHSGDIGGRNGH